MITAERFDGGPEARGALPPPFDRLVSSGTLTEAQATSVLAAIESEQRTQAPALRVHSGITARLAEIGAYIGAALVVAAGIVVVAQQWEQMTYGMRVTVMCGATAALLIAAGVASVFPHGRPWDDVPNGATLRRLCGTLFALGALAGFGTVLVAMLSGQPGVTEGQTATAFIVAGSVGFGLLAVGRWRAETPLTDLGLVAASLSVVAGLIQLWFTDEPAAIQWTLLSLGLAWALVGSFTRALRHHTLVTALGLALALFAAATIAEAEGSQRAALATLIIVSLTVYLVRPTWPYITVATIAAVVLTVTWVGPALGPALALLLAGLVVLLLAGVALWLHTHREESRGRRKS
jgi:hypothetical protein